MELQEVFGIATEVSQASYVDRGGLDQRFAYVLQTDRHIVIHGDSKQGKSWLRSRALSQDDSILVQCQVNSTAESILFYRKYGDPKWPWSNGLDLGEAEGDEEPLDLDD